MDNIKYIRPTWDEYFFDVTRAISRRATCGRGRSGCVIANDRHIVTTGYVGSPPGMPSCDEIGHLLKRTFNADDGTYEEHCLRTIHAEQNAICQAAKLGTSVQGATLYCTMTPCRVCAMLIVSAGIKHVKCMYHYSDKKLESDTLMMFECCGVSIEYASDEECAYE